MWRPRYNILRRTYENEIPRYLTNLPACSRTFNPAVSRARIPLSPQPSSISPMSPTFPAGKSRIVPGRYPPPGTDPYADAIHERRGERGLTPLDGNLLHVPAIAGGYNSLLGAIRTKGNLPGNIREAMILRIAAINHAAFEWIHHEPIGRKDGLTTGQLYIIRDTETPLPASPTLLNALQTVAVAYTDHSTRDIRIPTDIVDEFKKQLRKWALEATPTLSADEADAKADDLYVEAAIVVAGYNMVSRFLLGTDVAGLSDAEVPWPVERKEHFIELSSFPPAATPTHSVHAVTLITSPSAPWIVFANSLLTDWTMWSYVIPYFLDYSTGPGITYNLLLHSQRGHGQSTIPKVTDSQTRATTIPLLATDIASLLKKLSIQTPVTSVIGVSQGGAATLAFAAMYPELTQSIVACDTGARTPAGNKEAWEQRIRLVLGPDAPENVGDYARKVGMGALADATVPRWFPPGSSCNQPGSKQAEWVKQMIRRTDVSGCIAGARALGDYDTLSLGQGLFQSPVGLGILLAGTLDGDGKVGAGLQDLSARWAAESPKARQYLSVEGSGHLPMIDSPERFFHLISSGLRDFSH